MLRDIEGASYRTGDLPGPSQETGILISDRLTYLGHGSHFLSPEAKGFPSVGKERWGQDAVTGIGSREIAPIVLHPVAGPKKLADLTRDPLDRRYEMAMFWMNATISYHLGLGRDTVVIADIQMRADQTKQAWAPRLIFERFGMNWVWDGIDVIAWSPGLRLVGDPARRVVPGVLPDHPLLRVELDLVPKRRKNR